MYYDQTYLYIRYTQVNFILFFFELFKTVLHHHCSLLPAIYCSGPLTLTSIVSWCIARWWRSNGHGHAWLFSYFCQVSLCFQWSSLIHLNRSIIIINLLIYHQSDIYMSTMNRWLQGVYMAVDIVIAYSLTIQINVMIHPKEISASCWAAETGIKSSQI